MSQHEYNYYLFNFEPVPTMYLQVGRPDDIKPPVNVLAVIDTGAEITAIPDKYKQDLGLVWTGRRKISWIGEPPEGTSVYWAQVRAEQGEEAYRSRQIEIVFDTHHENYALIGRNLLKYWVTTLRGPEAIFEIEDST